MSDNERDYGKLFDPDYLYSRFELIPWWEQDVLSKAKILVVGCGALGNEIVKNLSMLGAGNILIVDMDCVEKSNLTRSVLFRSEDEGKPKAETGAKRAMEINENINARFFNGSIFEIGLGVFKEADVVICGLDNREARLYVNQACRKTGKYWIDGAIEVLSGVARVFAPEGPCYECTMSEMDYRLINKRKSCMMLGYDDIVEGKIPTTPTISSIIAGIQVQEAVKYLHIKNNPERESLTLLEGKGFIFNGATNESYIIGYTERDFCPSHYDFDVIIVSEINFEDVILSDVHSAGKNIFGTDDFQIDFNNEVVYSLSDEATGETEEYFGNINLMTVKDTRKGEAIMKINSFHSLNTGSVLFRKLSGRKLTELKIPVNDIITIRLGSKEVHIEFRNKSLFCN